MAARKADSDPRVEACKTASDPRVEACKTASDPRVEACKTASALKVEACKTASDPRMEACKTASDPRVEACKTASDPRVEACKTASDLKVEACKLPLIPEWKRAKLPLIPEWKRAKLPCRCILQLHTACRWAIKQPIRTTPTSSFCCRCLPSAYIDFVFFFYFTGQRAFPTTLSVSEITDMICKGIKPVDYCLIFFRLQRDNANCDSTGLTWMSRSNNSHRSLCVFFFSFFSSFSFFLFCPPDIAKCIKKRSKI